MNQKIFILIAIVLVGLGSGLLGKHLVLGGTYETTVAAASVEDQIIQATRSLQTYGGTEDIESQTLTVKNIQTFQDGLWVAATVAAGQEDPQDSSVVLKKVDNSYQFVVTPGTDFGELELKQLDIPDEVLKYIDQQGQLNREAKD